MGIHPSINCIEGNGKKILVIEVEKSSNPIAYNGRYYKRVGNTTMEMKEEELKNFFLRKENWDALTTEYNLAEIDEETVRNFIKMSVNKGRLPDEESIQVSEILLKLNLIIDGKLTNAALILFGKNPQKYFTNALVRVIRIKGNLSISDNVIKGNLFNQAEEAEISIRKSINVKYEIKGELFRDEIWDYPLNALREALLNSIIHRDYFKYSIQTQIKIYDDKIWFFNPGGVFGDLKIEDLKKPHPSSTRNPLIADVFYRAGLVEVYGSGIGEILNSFEDLGHIEPDFKEEFGGFSLYMLKGYTKEFYKEMGLNSRQIDAMSYLHSEGEITTVEYSEIAPEVSEGTLKRDLTDLVDKGIIKKIGSRKLRRYKLIKK
jgi:ATP-dependent DNA helicase RecG